MPASRALRGGASAPADPAAGRPATGSLAGRLLRVIFVCYFVVAVGVTAIQVFAEYRLAHRRLEDDIQAMQRTFAPGLADALWSFNGEVLRGILKGIAEMPVVVGVEVRDEHGRLVESLGATGATAAPRRAILDQPFSRSFGLAYLDESGRSHPVGLWTIRSNDGIAFDQVAGTLTVVLINSAVKTLTLWLIFFVVIRRMVGRPLAQVDAFLARLDADNMGTRPLVLRTRGSHELHRLASTLNGLAAKLRRAFDDNAALMRDLQDANATLQDRVAERTRELELLARTDLLTGLYNRRKLDEAIEREAARAREGGRFCVILGDVDHFKAVNDRHGHKVGDVVLVAFAVALRDGLRADDTLGRWGGEEFMALCPDTDLATAVSVAERLRCRMEETALPVAGVRTCSFGVAELQPGESVDGLVMRVDAALYLAKRNGRNRVEASGDGGADDDRRSAA